MEELVRQAKNYVAQSNRLPEAMKILITTSTLKEGVNIKDEKVRIAFCESHVLSDIQQFAGRVRAGLEILYIISDAKQHVEMDDAIRTSCMEVSYNLLYEIENANKYFNNVVLDSESSLYRWIGFDEEKMRRAKLFYAEDYSLYTAGNEAMRKFIDMIEKNNKYIRFNHLLNKFEIYTFRFNEQLRINRLLVHDDWKKKLKEFADKYGIAYSDETAKKQASSFEIEKRIFELIGKKLIGDEKEELLRFLASEFGISERAKISTYNKALQKHCIHYILKDGNTKVKGKPTRYIVIEHE